MLVKRVDNFHTSKKLLLLLYSFPKANPSHEFSINKKIRGMGLLGHTILYVLYSYSLYFSNIWL